MAVEQNKRQELTNLILECIKEVFSVVINKIEEKKYPNSAIRINAEKNKCIEKLNDLNAYTTALNCVLTSGEFKHEVRQFEKPYDNQQAEQISLMV